MGLLSYNLVYCWPKHPYMTQICSYICNICRVVVVFFCCLNKIPQTGWLKLQTFIFFQFCQLQVATNRLFFWRISSWSSESKLLTVSLHVSFTRIYTQKRKIHCCHFVFLQGYKFFQIRDPLLETYSALINS
jgi:hypothetical protein